MKTKDPRKDHYVKALLRSIDRSKKRKSKHKTITINNYERYWDSSTPTGHVIDIVSQNGDMLTIKMNWPKGYSPRLSPYTRKQ
tara:strand:- start:11034 stop:11282 length:249 start_codon:yes stop_codon:yes gene_type:complete